MATVYLDGVPVMSAMLNPPAFDDNPLTIGFDVNNGAPALAFEGALDDLRSYGRALDDTDIAALAGS